MKCKFPLVLAVTCLGASLQAATVGYWRFENSSSLGADSGPNALNLTVGSTAYVGTVFPNPVPQTGDSNTGAADFELSSSNVLTVADNAAFAFQNFTIEAYAQLESIGGGTTSRIIASQLRTGSGVSAAWQFGVAGTGSGLGNSHLFMQLSQDGTNLLSFSNASDTNFALAVGKSYYVAASVNFTGTTADVSFYIKNLTDGGTLVTNNDSKSMTSLFNSTTNFAVGASFDGGSSTRNFDGLIDEVRLSNVVLGSSELLTSAVPEPSLFGLASVALAGLLLLRRRN